MKLQQKCIQKKCKFYNTVWYQQGFPSSTVVKNPSADAGDVKSHRYRVRKIPLEEEMATHFSIIAWEIL